MTATTEVTTPTEREIVLTRAFEAPASLVFDFHTKPEHVQRWLLGPAGWTMPVCEIDLRVGGQYRYLWRASDGSGEFGVTGEFCEISAPHGLVHTERFDGAPGEAVCTLSLRESGGQTILSMAMLFPSTESRDQALQSGMTDGTAASYDCLDALMKADAPQANPGSRSC